MEQMNSKTLMFIFISKLSHLAYKNKQMQKSLFKLLYINILLVLCDVTLSVYPHREGLKNMPGHGGNRTYDLWNTSPMLCQLSYAVRSVRVRDISELSL